MTARCVSLLAAAASVSAQLHVPWSTDLENGTGNRTFGPDGPWQAAIIKLNGTQLPLWPGGSGVSEIPTKDIGGLYTLSDDAVKTGRSRKNSDTWFSGSFTGASWLGDEYWDDMELEPKAGSSRKIEANATFVAATEWSSGAPLNGTNYKPSVGILGLGPRSERSDVTTVPSILEQLKAAGEIDRNAFSVHIGSVALDIPGSLVLGGYEQNRALGQVGTFPLTESIPLMYLRDVIMDVETGNPTFYPLRSNGSFWQESTDFGKQFTQNAGGAAGSVVVVPNPASPYIYLPPGICEGIAANLKMTLHDATGLYLWGSDPQVEVFVNSPAYLGFVLSDQSATNLTVKVPFKLLNLTLEPPLVERAVNYFPCKSINSTYGFWQLGRAFLQAAFLAMDYDGKVAYVAQAPGPALEQSILKRFDNSTISTNAAESFASTWKGSWAPVSVSRSFDSEDKGLTPGGRAGIAVAAVVGIFAALWFWRRRRKSRKGPEAPPDAVDKAMLWLNEKRGKSQKTKAASQANSVEENGETGGNGGLLMENHIEQKTLRTHKATELNACAPASELDTRTPPVEVGVPLPHEMDSHTESTQMIRHEAPNDYMVYELPAAADGTNRRG